MFYRIQENMIIDNADFNYSDECKYTDICTTKEYQEDPLRYTLIDGEIAINPNYEEDKKQKERERINKLTCTKRVFVLMLQELGIDYLTMLKPLIESNAQAQLEWDLCVELERGNPLLDIMAGQLGVTPEQLDGLFLYHNGEITLEQFKELIPTKEQDDNNTGDATV